MILASCPLDGLSGHEAGRKLLAQLYRRETGEDLPPILKTERGKPYFENNPWHFSISHTKRRVFCVLSRKNIAIDAEELDRNIDLRLGEKILSPGEIRQFASAPDRRLALLTFWVLKEASVKLSGQGLRGYPDHTDFSLEDPRVRILDGCLVAVMEERPAACSTPSIQISRSTLCCLIPTPIWTTTHSMRTGRSCWPRFRSRASAS